MAGSTLLQCVQTVHNLKVDKQHVWQDQDLFKAVLHIGNTGEFNKANFGTGLGTDGHCRRSQDQTWKQLGHGAWSVHSPVYEVHQT